MAKTLELIGVSGVGKTSVYNRLRWSQPRLTNACTLRSVQRQRLLASGGLKGLLRWLEFQIRPVFPSALQSSTLQRFIEQNPDLSLLVLTLIHKKCTHDKNTLARAYRGFELFCRTFVRYQMIKEYRARKYVLMQEGFVQRLKGFSLEYGTRLDASLHEHISNLVNGIVFLSAPPEVIEERLRWRSKRRDEGELSLPSMEDRLNEIRRSILAYEKVIPRLEEKGVSCWRIDASGSLHQTVRKVAGVLGNL